MSSSLRLGALAFDAVASARNSWSGAWPGVTAQRRAKCTALLLEVSTLGHVFWVDGNP
jgi:hypothetical protein